MNKTTFCTIIIMTSIMSLNAQIYTPGGTVQGNSNNNNNNNVGIGTSTPIGKLDVVKTTTTNENDVIANFIRFAGPTGGSTIVRFGYHNTGDFEIIDL